MRLLLTAYDYRPKLGGIATVGQELTSALAQLPGVELRLLTRELPGSDAWDKNAQFPIIRVPLHNQTALASLQLVPKLREQIRLFKPDAILNYLWLPEATASYLAAGHVPYFTLVHGVEILEARSTLKKRIRAALSPLKNHVLRNAKLLFAVSHFTEDRLIELCGVPPSKIRVNYSGVDANRFKPKPPNPELVKKHRLQGRRVLFTTARLWDYKGIDFAIRSLVHVREKFPEILLIVGGDGRDRKRLEELSQSLSLQNHVIFTGEIPQDLLVDYYNLAEINVLLTREDRKAPNFEGFGLVFLEAAACGKPSIAGRSGGIPEAVVGGKTGWLVNPTDEHAIANQIVHCLSNHEMTRVFGENARNHVTQYHSWHQTAARLLSEIEKNVRN